LPVYHQQVIIITFKSFLNATALFYSGMHAGIKTKVGGSHLFQQQVLLLLTFIIEPPGILKCQ
jgi:hypothetical protein